MKMRLLKAGTPLYHGTDMKEKFRLIICPAWFAFDWDTAAKWAGWASKSMPELRPHRRVLEYTVTEEMILLDTEKEEDWDVVMDKLCEGDDAVPAMAVAVKKAGYKGWFGKREVMLTGRRGVELVGVKPVPPHVKSFSD